MPMRISSRYLRFAIVLSAALCSAGAAHAGTPAEVPAPGVLGLIAFGVIAAIALARHRK